MAELEPESGWRMRPYVYIWGRAFAKACGNTLAAWFDAIDADAIKARAFLAEAQKLKDALEILEIAARNKLPAGDSMRDES